MAGADFLPRLAKRVGATARASAAFGKPVEHDGVTVIPVAKAAWGFGGGSGGEDASEGAGGGGGGFVVPIGFIEVRDSGAQFVPLHDRRRSALLLCAAAGIAAVLVRSARNRSAQR